MDIANLLPNNMPEGGEVSAVAKLLNKLLAGKEVCIQCDGQTKSAVVRKVQSRGKLVRFSLVVSDGDRSRCAFFAHFGLSGGLWFSSHNGQFQSVLHDRVAKNNPKKPPTPAATVEWTIDNIDNQPNATLLFAAGTGSRYRWEEDKWPEDLGLDWAHPDAKTKWMRANANSKRNLEGLLTDQDVFAGAGKKLRKAAFEALELDGKEKACSLSPSILESLIDKVVEVAQTSFEKQTSVSMLTLGMMGT
jgi:formamidopyrimidine-DNA glycosylase